MIIAIKPYKKYGDTLRPFFNLLISLFIETIYFLMQSISSSYNSYFPFAILALLAVTLTYNLYYLFKGKCSK
jgi:hypothetical protein